MIHFIRQMQAYARLEVVECSWMKLIDFLSKKEGDLDALIEAHRSYLDQMMKKIFLQSPKAGKEVFQILVWLLLSSNGSSSSSFNRKIYSTKSVKYLELFSNFV